MIFGMTVFTWVHVVISLVGIGSGCVVVYGFLTAKRLDVWTAIFLATTVLTSVTGFFFPFERFLPSHAVGILSLIVLAVAIVARYRLDLAGRWRAAYVVSSVLALYLNVFVLVSAAFSESPGIACCCADSIGAGIPADPTHGVGRFRRDRGWRDVPVSTGACPPAPGLASGTDKETQNVPNEE